MKDVLTEELDRARYAVLRSMREKDMKRERTIFRNLTIGTIVITVAIVVAFVLVMG